MRFRQGGLGLPQPTPCSLRSFNPLFLMNAGLPVQGKIYCTSWFHFLFFGLVLNPNFSSIATLAPDLSLIFDLFLAPKGPVLVTLRFFSSRCGSPADPYITTWSASKVLLGSFSSPRDKGKSSHVFCPVHLPPFLLPFSSFFPEEG